MVYTLPPPSCRRPGRQRESLALSPAGTAPSPGGIRCRGAFIFHLRRRRQEEPCSRRPRPLLRCRRRRLPSLFLPRILNLRYLSVPYEINSWRCWTVLLLLFAGALVALNGTLGFCSAYSGRSSCRDAAPRKQLEATNVSDAACAGVVKSVLCAVPIVMSFLLLLL